MKDLLVGQGLPTGDYHPSFDDEWYASSTMLELDGGVFPNNLAYYIEGDQHAARRLKLKLNINNPEYAANAEEGLWIAARILLQAVLDSGEAEEAAEALRGADAIDRLLGKYRVQLRREDFTGLRGGYSRIFLIEHTVAPSAS